MKVILTVKSPTFTRFYNYQVPTKYGAWFELLITYIFVPKLPLLAQAAGLIAGYSYIVTPNADALVACASCNIRHFLIRIGLIKRPEQWWRVWPRFRNAVRRRISLQKT
ncbi:unnamed protein product [Peronospora belbahrii]|nr:unnamed protein product [Peronospora belbahrii]